MTYLSKAKWLLWIFAKFKVPMIGYTGIRLCSIDEKEVCLNIKLKRKTKNHVNSMYFGALAVGADVAGGLHAVYHAKAKNVKIAPLFKSFQAEFHRRAESDVTFICKEGLKVRDMITQAKLKGERVNDIICIEAYTENKGQRTHVASFKVELSVKVRHE